MLNPIRAFLVVDMIPEQGVASGNPLPKINTHSGGTFYFPKA